MATKMFEVQQSIFQRLQQYESFTDKVTGLYDYVPEKTELPYATFGRVHSQPLNTKVDTGETISTTIDVWSQSKGKKEAVEIIAAIEEALKDELQLKNIEIVSQKISNREVWEENYGLFAGQIDIEIQIMEEL
ncbi:DUF3168 domain-containing protein (plasmid) [Desemzia incerta]|uniref:DUF3168 domain-containing protein n=1 Tax=Desemzia incerta TaxID=82801 RepID=UPI0024C2BE15|nr:DUF3168 domain-containing protein [Desemzia incerta]WHZ33212.1 DUF3168 domain-containing protein [Desemzia incerta]